MKTVQVHINTDALVVRIKADLTAKSAVVLPEGVTVEFNEQIEFNTPTYRDRLTGAEQRFSFPKASGFVGQRDWDQGLTQLRQQQRAEIASMKGFDYASFAGKVGALSGSGCTPKTAGITAAKVIAAKALREAGFSYAHIGRVLGGVTKQHAHRLVNSTNGGGQ